MRKVTSGGGIGKDKQGEGYKGSAEVIRQEQLALQRIVSDEKTVGLTLEGAGSSAKKGLVR